ncbi:methyltransferase family protein [Nocardia sp. NBC_01327]|uniref:methyltransferase family protein n=1 Tax=Nocardia sp. NBC_01327 TaxID=2903593 RepID=UPI002E11F80E|nr:isoprenylcysteine carboxylmethyltransferase family protein [Nocardia sp. NBC_01327]
MNAAVVTSWIWLALELGLRIRDRVRHTGSTARDRGTRFTIFLLMFPSVLVASIVAGVLSSNSPLRFPGPQLVWEVVGVMVMWLGLIVRIWAIAVLGKSFRTTVEVDADQSVVDRGPYHWIRHPSYTGVLLITLGFGIAADNWISLLVVTIIPTYGLMRRIDVEEKALVETMGRPYEIYRSTTKRLVPGIW